MTRKVPTLNFKDYTSENLNLKEKFVDNLFEGLKNYGFIILKNHDLSKDLIDKTYKEINTFFELSTETKMKYGNSLGGQKGYTCFGKEKAKDAIHPDLKEFWHTKRKGALNNDLWPMDEVPNFKVNHEEMFTELEAISYLLLEAIGLKLEVPKDFFKKMITDGNSLLRSIHYPPTTKLDTKNSVRAAAHEDINLITLLVGATNSGLELLDKDGKWLSVESNPGEIIVDTGDMMSRLTNLVLPSTTHRVINPEETNSSRYSIPFFVHPHSEASLRCLDSCIGKKKHFTDIKAGEFLNQRLREIGLL